MPAVLVWISLTCTLYCIRLIRHRGYYSFCSSILCSFSSRAAFISLSQSLHWRSREQSSIEWLLDRQENLLVVADWFTSLFWVCFVSSRRVYACARATQVFVKPTAATIREWCLFHSARGGVATVWKRLLIESGVWSSGYSRSGWPHDLICHSLSNIPRMAVQYYWKGVCCSHIMH